MDKFASSIFYMNAIICSIAIIADPNDTAFVANTFYLMVICGLLRIVILLEKMVSKV